MLCRADDTGEWIHPPQELSSSGGPTHFEEVSGRGKVFSFIVVRQATVPGHEVPYVVGIIELDEQSGLRLTGIINADPEIVEIGAAVRAKFSDIGSSGFRAPEFDLISD
ncbi:Zn-ribbon domain-containing OB-fold protein [Nocardia sp. NBC_00565]|uniref:Zn-ribbon domain-containing OB-fold protein n=1 Tax=Nocardia sp. NBC_00565 TaxID=2975993 RepID=UPI003FA5FA53